MDAIEIKNLTKSYQGNKVVNNISLTIKSGEIFGFIGPNGAGKSTTIKMLLNFIFPTAGSAEILGLDCVKESLEIKRIVGYVSSDVRYYHGMTSLDIFNYTAAFHRLKNKEKLIDYYMAYFEINPNKKIADLSLGNKKKVAIVSALLQEPKLLILDEPTNGLDPMIQHKLFELLEQKRQEGMTIFLSSHDLHEIQTYCDRAAFIKQGEIIAVEEINKNSNLAKKIIMTTKELTEIELLAIGGENIQLKDNQVTFMYQGNINHLLDLLAQKKILDIEIKPLDIEDKFLSMY